MEKVLNIEGMVCGMCVKHVDKALRDIQGIKDVDVSLESKSAQVQLDQDVPDAVLKAAIEDAGYQLVSIQERAVYEGQERRYCSQAKNRQRTVRRYPANG